VRAEGLACPQSEAGKRSWAKRPDAERARRLRALQQAADQRKAGRAQAALWVNSEYRFEVRLAWEIARLRAEDKREGREPQKYYRLVEYTGFISPPCVRRPGRGKRAK
jgi:hypothetical protein